MEVASVLMKSAGLLFQILGSPVAKEIKSIWKYEDDVKRLAETVGFVGAVLEDLERNQSKLQGASVKSGYKRLREAFLDAEDFLDTIEYHKKKHEAGTKKLNQEKEEMMNKANGKRKQLVAHARIKNKAFLMKTHCFFSASNRAMHATKMHNALQKIRKNLDVIATDLQSFKLSFTPKATDCTTIRATGPIVEAAKMIGREADKSKIIDLLLRSSNDPMNIPVISIVGMGGLGKTTIAQLLYVDKIWQKGCRFDLKLWVPDSKKFDVKSLLKNMLKSISLGDPSLDILDENHLRERLVNGIGGKRFFLVLDDVEIEDLLIWEQLQDLLNHGNKEGSRILVTTRSKKVAKIMGSDSPYELQGLSETDALQLFERYAFRGRRDEELVEIRKLIVRKCLGVPLAIKVIGSLLCGKDQPMWERVKDTGLVVKDERNQIVPILKISYYNLDSTLKQCFSYFALFPKKFSITEQMFSSVWRANVCLKNGCETLADGCLNNLKTLCDRCLLEETRRGLDVYFKMHDLIHELAVDVAEEEMIVMKSDAKVDSNKLILEESVRHVSFFQEIIKVGKPSTFEVKGRRLHTFLSHGGSFSFDPDDRTHRVDELVIDCPVLRLLDIHSWGIKKLPNSIGKMIHLRHLDLSRNEFHTLPDSIVKLMNLRHLNLSECEVLTHFPSGMGALTSLQLLDMSHCLKLKELPVGISKLINLEYLSFEYCFSLSRMPFGMGALPSIVMGALTLEKFIVGDSESKDDAQLEELGPLSEAIKTTLKIVLPNSMSLKESWDGQAYLLNKTELRSLEIEWQDNPKKKVPSNHVDILAKLQPPPNLEEFRLYGYQGSAFPPWFPSEGFASILPNLKEINMSNCMKFQHLPPLIGLQNLERLKLWGLNDLEYIEENVSAASFCPSLKSLELHELPELKGWCKGLTIGAEDEYAEHEHEQSLMLPSFPCLEKLEVHYCQNLTVAPILASFVKVFTVNASSSSAPQLSSSSLNFLVQLCTLGGGFSLIYTRPHLGLDISNLNSGGSIESIIMVESVREMSNHLTSLGIHNCPGLKNLPGGAQATQHLTALQRLRIMDCCEFTGDSGDGDMSWNQLQRLEELILSELPKMARLPEGIQFITSLRTLVIEGCDKLVLPQWLRSTFQKETPNSDVWIKKDHCLGLT